MRKYLESLRNREEGMPRKAQELAKYYCWGWYQGSAEGKRALAKKVAAGSEVTDWEGVDRRELNEARWEAVVVEELKARGIAESEIVESPKGAYWKVEITLRLRAETTASNPWIAERLHMGHPSRITNLLRSVAS